MEQHDLDIEIGKDGKVRVRIEGVKGKGCLDYARFLEQIVGKIQSQELTAEYYEPESDVRIDLGAQDRQQQRRKG